MEPDQTDKVFRMIESHRVLSVIEMSIVSDREKINENVCVQAPEGQVLVIFEIPREICMPVFYGEFYKVLNEEPLMANTCERKG